MTTKEIFNYFDKIGSLTFSTINGEYPESRIAHFGAYDEEGLYFMTMHTKPFYKQLKATGKLSACGLCADSKIEETEDGNLIFDDGYFARITGDVKEISIEEIKRKNNPIFDYCIKDNERYPAMVVFCLYRGRGEIFDYDFEKIKRPHKLERLRFSFGGMEIENPGLTIDRDKCIACGKCESVCSFSAIFKKDGKFEIMGERCDECGSCYLVCPAQAINSKGR